MTPTQKLSGMLPYQALVVTLVLFIWKPTLVTVGGLAVVGLVYVAVRVVEIRERAVADLAARVSELEGAVKDLGAIKEQVARWLNRPPGR